MSLLKFIVLNKDLNDSLCFSPSKINILKFGRIYRLLTNNYEKYIIEKYISNHIDFIKIIFIYFKEEKKIVFNQIKKVSNLN